VVSTQYNLRIFFWTSLKMGSGDVSPPVGGSGAKEGNEVPQKLIGKKVYFLRKVRQ